MENQNAGFETRPETRPETRQVHFSSNSYPLSLRDLTDPPPILSVEGLLDFDRPVLAVVGARDSSVMAESWMRRHLPALSKVAIIVSGGARGIDELAHQIAMQENRPTAVVLPSALDCPYPVDWIHRRRRVLETGGCLISEYETGTTIRKSHFEKRNRLIAALADVVLIVEARRRSGTAITARHAAKLGRVVVALPWFPSDPRGELCNDLIVEKDAMLVRSADDIAGFLAEEVGTRKLRMQRTPFLGG